MSRLDDRCLEESAMRGFLNEQLTDAEQARVEDHIGTCADCQQRLEMVVTEGTGWDEFRDHLADYSSEPILASDEQPVEDCVNLKTLLAPTDDPQMLGRLGRYEVSGIIGQGSTGIVLRAFDAALSRNVAIKMLAPAYAHLATSRRRFEREGRAISAVRDPHVIAVHGVEEYQGTPYIIMQYIPNGSLHDRLARDGELSTKEVCRIGMQIARGLEAAHRQGIIHRDIKPANILLEDGVERAIVTDFSLARVADEATMTLSGTIAGTPQFMSPEQARGESLDHRTDLFSLGCVMYATCTGHSPFRGETVMGVVHRVCETEPRLIREINPEIDEWLEAFVVKLLAKLKDDRFQSAADVADLLELELAYLQMPTTAAPQRAWWKRDAKKTPRTRWTQAMVGLLVVVAGIAGVWKLLPQPTNAVSVNDTFGITPTEQERSFYKAKAAYDLAYETHLSEQELSGDMTESIQRHKAALKAGYDKARSNYNLARAYAIENNAEQALSYLNAAIESGFHDHENTQGEQNFRNIQNDPRFKDWLDQVRGLEVTWQQLSDLYFQKKDFASAEQGLRNWLTNCPNDELAVMLLGAALTELKKIDEAKLWNERARNSIQYANFGAYNLGCIAFVEGDKDLAFGYLNYAASIGFTDADHLEHDHMLRELRGDPRFQTLLKQLRNASTAKAPQD